MIFKLLIPIIFGVCFCDARRYENYTLFRGIPVEDRHLDFLRNLSSVYDVNFWRMPGSLRMPVDFLIAPNDKESFLKEAQKIGVNLNTIMDDIQSAFDKQTIKSYTRKRMDSFGWNDFYRTKDIYNWLRDLEREFPLEVKVFSIGKTYEERDIMAIRVIKKGSLIRSTVMIEGGIHAREWISPAFVTYLIHQIVYSHKSSDNVLNTIAKTYEWYFVPVLNPDGYEYTFAKDRIWRKNRFEGTGVDVNRNFGYGFGNEGVSFDRHSVVHCGKKAFSEKESSAMGRFIRSKHNHLEYYISFHSYGQYIIIPYSHSTKHMENYDEVHAMGLRAATKIKSYYNTIYKVGTAYETVGYKVSGASVCWAKKSFGIPYAVTYELRDQGSYGFALPAKAILPTCKETLGGILTMLLPMTKDFKTLKHEYIVVDEVDPHSGQTWCLPKIGLIYFVMLIIMLFI